MQIFPTIILPALIFLLVGGALGIGLAFIHERFKTTRDPKSDEVLRFLPGANCGGCGSGGCEAFAQKLARGEADVASCGPCTDENAESIRKLVGSNAAVGAGAAAGSQSGTAATSTNNGNEPKRREKKTYRINAEGCGGCGLCKNACPFHAITVLAGIAMIDPEKCKSCGKCVTVCPNSCIKS
ncbi:MAG: RnfABCDGE type electron transport complex subunit B [Firmicutes bacterium]|nr:RnfABCDGE type electron transport complex subunit B [Bacillota bacterium]